MFAGMAAAFGGVFGVVFALGALYALWVGIDHLLDRKW